MALFPPRADVSSDTAMLPAIAMHISKQVGCALLVEYDTRVGHRAAKLFQSGNLVAELGPHSERFVPLADDGKPALSAEWLHADQLDPDEEYETVQNAIELGLAKIDYCTWEQFKRMLASI